MALIDLKDAKISDPKHFVSENWIRLLAVLGLISGALKVYKTIANYLHLGPQDQPDFNLYYFAFDTVLHRPYDIAQLYDHAYLQTQLHALGVSESFVQASFFGYPPQFAVFFAPLAYLGLQPAKLVWLSVSAVMLFVSMVMLVRLCFGDQRGGRGNSPYTLMLALAALSAPLYMEFQFGQSNCLLLFLLTASFFLKYEKRSSWLAGVPLGIAIAFKITPVLIPVFYLLRRDWRLGVSSFIVVLLGTLGTAYVTGWQLLLRYPFEYLPELTRLCLLNGPAPWNSAFRGALERIAIDLHAPLSAAVLSGSETVYRLAVLAAVAMLTLHSAENRRRDMSLAALLPLMLSPVIERHHVVLAFIPLAATVATICARRTTRSQGAGGTQPVAQSMQDDERRSLAKATVLVAATLVIFAANPIWISYTIAIPLLLGAVLYASRAPHPVGAATWLEARRSSGA